MLKAIAFTLVTLLFVTACGANDKKPKIKMGDKAAAKARADEEIKNGGYNGYKILTPEELFASKFSKADLSCDVFAVDKLELDPNEKATAVIVLPLVPTLIQTKDVTVTTPSGTYQVEARILEVDLVSFDTKVDKKIAGQTPVVDVVGEVTVSKLVESKLEAEEKPKYKELKKIGFGKPILAELDENFQMIRLKGEKALAVVRCKVLKTLAEAKD